ncbi:MAG: branched-chain amino acid ABC transporter permease [Anaerolineales bacterium]|nr:branched-chain amino acid ABC transporter permease [Anaerolineales bacterium]
MITVDFLLNAVSLGSLYALMALGLVIVYGILNMVNFAYGELIMFGGYMLYLLGSNTSLPWGLVALLAVFGALAMSYLTELVAFRKVREKSLTALLITSFAVSTLLQNGALLMISPRAKAVALPAIFSTSVVIYGNTVPMRTILTIVSSLLLLVLVTILFRKTVLGIALRAAADNFQMARMLGVPANLVISSAFALSGAIAGVVSLFWIGRTASVTPTIGATPLLIAFVATVIGGMNSLTGAVVGGFVYGILFSFIGVLLPQGLLNYREAFMFIIVIVILVLRPEGLVRGKHTEERVG